jgi:hypothetical protein
LAGGVQRREYAQRCGAGHLERALSVDRAGAAAHPVSGCPPWAGFDISPIILLLIIVFIERVIQEYVYPNVF